MQGASFNLSDKVMYNGREMIVSQGKDGDGDIKMTPASRDLSGIKAISDALSVSASLTKMLVGWNKLGDEGTAILCDALRKSTVTKVQELGLEVNEIGPEGAKAVAALCAAMASLTKIS